MCALAAFTTLAGCESFGRGVTQVVLESTAGSGPDKRICEVEGHPFGGIEPYLRRQDALPPFAEGVGDRPEVKVLYVHGIGTHLPGHGTALATNLARQLGLDQRAPRPKRIVLHSDLLPDQNLGELNVLRLTDQPRRRDLMFYELTWSPITDPDKALIAFDKEQYYQLRRATVNQAMRSFVNDIAPDPLAYNGERREPILVSIGQSLCWVLSASWSDLPELTEGLMCSPRMPGFGSRTTKDDFVFVSHSLGSRATIDALQRLTSVTAISDPRLREVGAQLREREVQVFMLSNQLPLLEAGQSPQAVTASAPAYCGPGGAKAGERFFARTRMIAFSDPNDLMSYPVPDRFAERYIDSRLCPAVTNVTINVASVNSLLGFGDVANPLTAHVGYNVDERVGALIAKGIGHDDTAPIVGERCTWRETDESLMR